MSNYKYAVLSDAPIGFWPWMDPNLTADISGFNKNVTSLVQTGMDTSYLPFVAGMNPLSATNTTRARGLGFSNTSQQIIYPNLEFWGHGQENTPFTIEFWIHPIDTSNEGWIFVPRVGSASIPNNGIKIQDNTIKFTVSDTRTANSTITATATAFLDEPEDSYHVLCVYQIDTLAVYVNGELLTTAGVPSSMVWNSTPDNYITTSTSQSSTLSYVLGPVAAYKNAIGISESKNHYMQQSLIQSPIAIAKVNEGNIFYLNNADRARAFSDGPPFYRSWEECTMYNVKVNEFGNAGLRQIAPMRVSSGTVNNLGSRTGLSGNYLIVDDLQTHLLSNSGAVGFYFNLSSANNNGIEQGIAALLDGNRRTAIELVKKTDNKIYLRYRYRLDTTESVVDTLIATPTYPSDNYAFIQFDTGQINVLLNATQITLDLSSYMPVQITPGSKFYLGADTDTSFGGQVWLLNIWNTTPDINNIPAVRNNVDWYTAKLGTNLKVSQYGYIKFSTHSGNDGTEFNGVAAVQTSVTWRPVNSSIIVSSSTDDVNYTNTIWHAELPINKNPLPPLVYIRAILTTDDSMVPPYLKQLFIDSFSNNDIFGENALDQLVGMTAGHLEPSVSPMLIQSAHHGTRVFDINSSFRISPQNLLVSVTPDGATVPVTGRVSDARTIEFWFRPESGGYLFYYQGAPENSFQINSSGQVTVNGFTYVLIDGVAFTGTPPFSASLVNPFQKWHHVILSKPTAFTLSDTPAQQAWFSRGPGGVQGAVSRFQYPTYYSVQFTDVMAKDVFRRWLGDTGNTLVTSAATSTDELVNNNVRDSLTSQGQNPRVMTAGWTVLKSTS